MTATGRRPFLVKIAALALVALMALSIQRSSINLQSLWLTSANNLDCISENRINKSTQRTPPLPITPLRDIHIVMIGDSLMRYQYLSLVYRLRYGVWFNTSMWYFNLVSEMSFQDPYHTHTWGAFLFHTNQILQPYEVCDCSRNPKMRFRHPDVIENRYYFDPSSNNSVVFLQALGHRCPIRGRLAPDRIRTWKNQQQRRQWQMNTFIDYNSFAWRYYDWADLIQKHVRNLDPQPRHIIMNAGLWLNNFGWSSPLVTNGAEEPTQPPLLSPPPKLSQETQALLRVVQELPEFQFTWRTNTYNRDRFAIRPDTDQVMCQHFPTCLNVSFTRQLRKDLFVDLQHFAEPVYRIENEMMLDLWGYLPSDYVRLNVSEVFLA